jgi:hypothetical protein
MANRNFLVALLLASSSIMAQDPARLKPNTVVRVWSAASGWRDKRGRVIALVHDTLTVVLYARSPTPLRAALSDVDSLHVSVRQWHTHAGRGAVEGALIFGALGFSLPYVDALVHGYRASGGVFDSAAIFFGALGAIGGAIVGAIAGHPVTQWKAVPLP